MANENLDLRLKYKFWIENGNRGNLLGEGKWLLLKAIRETGSLKAAVEEMGYTYRQTWENLKKIEKKLGFQLIEKSRGGASGGQTILTSKGIALVNFFDNLYSELNPVIEEHLTALQKELNEIVIKD
jgi:molybdate transport system regulatory protein